MAAPTYNCPFSAVAGSTDQIMTCTEVRAMNTDAGCPLYSTVHEDCTLALVMQRSVIVSGGSTPPEG